MVIDCAGHPASRDAGFFPARALLVLLTLTGGLAVLAVLTQRVVLAAAVTLGQWSDQPASVPPGDVVAAGVVALSAGSLLALAGQTTASALLALVPALLRGSRPAGIERLPRRTRWWVGLALGSTLCAGPGLGPAAATSPPGAPSAASTDTAIEEHVPPSRGAARLPVPDRAVLAAPHRATRPPRPGAARLVVTPGDSLWALAGQLVSPSSDPAQQDAAWKALYRHNRRTIGAEPDLIYPGTVLRVPAELRATSDATNPGACR